MNQHHDLVKQTNEKIIFANIDEENIITTAFPMDVFFSNGKYNTSLIILLSKLIVLM